LFNCFSCGINNKSLRASCYDGETFEAYTPKNIKEDKQEYINLEPYIPDNYRGIRGKVLEAHGAYFTKTPDGKETVHFTYPDGTKHRELPKSIKCSGKMNKFYGQDEYSGGQYITITEGEEDRLSVIQMMGDFPVVSVPGATPSKEFWSEADKFLSKFDKIILSIDNDTPGDTLADKFYRMYPEKTYRVNHAVFKDANEYLQNNKAADYKKAWWGASRLKPSNILCNTEDFLKLYDDTPDYEYVETGIPELDEKMLGIHKAALTVILAPTGIGKTEFMRYLEDRIISHSDYSVASCHGEETQLRSLLGLVSYDLKENLTRKDLIEQKGYESQVKESISNIAKKERYYQFSVKVHEGVDEIVDQVRFLATGMGVDYIFLEPIQDFVSASNTTEKESLLTDLTNKLKRLAPELNVGIVVIAHANEDGEAKYCRSLVQGAAFEIQLDRDPDSDDVMEKNRTYIRVGRKNRTGGGSGAAGVMVFDSDTYMLEPEISSQPVFDRTKSEVVGF
jgi:twinkle protein